MLGGKYLTTVDPALDQKTKLTVPGMAHFAEPTSNARCGSCLYWRDEKNSSIARRCQKFSELMNGIRGPKIPRNTFACKFYEL